MNTTEVSDSGSSDDFTEGDTLHLKRLDTEGYWQVERNGILIHARVLLKVEPEYNEVLSNPEQTKNYLLSQGGEDFTPVTLQRRQTTSETNKKSVTYLSPPEEDHNVETESHLCLSDFFSVGVICIADKSVQDSFI
eukprot:TRINITY_DN3826_c0_g2_i3.p1 TRINITY_DN3826_c0_g2~~TRINITY_DN3826_c0_g2_i3.p1  ORF type:complete len:136 (-),score=17.60 TRINITY_DN3826_c0_g2_i3:269-676(-)